MFHVGTQRSDAVVEQPRLGPATDEGRGIGAQVRIVDQTPPVQLEPAVVNPFQPNEGREKGPVRLGGRGAREESSSGKMQVDFLEAVEEDPRRLFVHALARRGTRGGTTSSTENGAKAPMPPPISASSGYVGW